MTEIGLLQEAGAIAFTDGDRSVANARVTANDAPCRGPASRLIEVPGNFHAGSVSGTVPQPHIRSVIGA